MNFDNYVCDGQMSFDDIFGESVKVNKPIRLIELFAGVGSQAMALRNIGAEFEHYRMVEFDKYAVASYNAIHGTVLPKHGRLIDADALKKHKYHDSDRYENAVAVYHVDNAPTILEAWGNEE